MITPLYKKMKKNGTTLYVFPSVEEDKNFEHQNNNYNMYLSHYVLVKFPRQTQDKLNFEATFDQNLSSIPPVKFKDALVESLRNYVANHESVIRNSKINQTDFLYDTFELKTTTEKIFWKWCKSLGIIDFEPANPNLDYFGNDSKYADNGNVGNTDFFKKYLWKERTDTIYSVNDIQFNLIANSNSPDPVPTPSSGKTIVAITLNSSTNFKIGDYIVINKGGIDDGIIPSINQESVVKIVGLFTSNTLNDIVLVEIDDAINGTNYLTYFGDLNDLQIQLEYDRFVQFICEIGGLNNVQLPNKAYTESFAYISSQHGQLPYSLFETGDNNNYKPNSVWPLLPQEFQSEIQGGQNANNPILTNPNLYPGDIWAQFDQLQTYKSSTGDANRRIGDYYGVYANNNSNPTLKYPDFNGSKIDGLNLNLNITDYALTTAHIYPIETFNEFCSTSFNNEPPKDFEFNAILWYYTVEDVSGNNTNYATNLYGIEFLDTPENDKEITKNKIPFVSKLVSNGYQDGNAFTFSLDTNIFVDSGTSVPEFDPDKVYSLFGFELYNEAMKRLTYFNDTVTQLTNNNLLINQKVNDLSSLVFNQQQIQDLNTKIVYLENLLNVYSTLQIGDSDSIVAYLDTSENPAMVKLKSIDKRLGNIYQYDTKTLYNEIPNNTNTLITINEKIIPTGQGKDVLVLINNNDNSVPNLPYDLTTDQETLKLVIEKDLQFKQNMQLLILPKNNIADQNNPTNLPINDKKLELYINYNSGNQIVKQLIGKYNLPVNVFESGLNYINEPHVGINRPEFIIRDIYYRKPNTNQRVFSLIVEHDLLINDFIQPNCRVYLDNFYIKTNPANQISPLFNLTGQYEVLLTSHVKDKIVDIEIIDQGSGYPNTGLSDTDINAKDIFMSYTASSGQLTSVELISHEGNFTQQEFINEGLTNINGGTGGTVKFIVKKISQIDIVLNYNANNELNALLTTYDQFYNIDQFINKRSHINQDLKCLPILTLLKGFEIDITRISENDLPITQFNNRYTVKTKLLS